MNETNPGREPAPRAGTGPGGGSTSVGVLASGGQVAAGQRVAQAPGPQGTNWLWLEVAQGLETWKGVQAIKRPIVRLVGALHLEQLVFRREHQAKRNGFLQ